MLLEVHGDKEWIWTLVTEEKEVGSVKRIRTGGPCPDEKVGRRSQAKRAAGAGATRPVPPPWAPTHFREASDRPSQSAYRLAVGAAGDMTGKVL